jgi:hypothetical protein
VLEAVAKTCSDIDTAGGKALAELEKAPYKELLISSVQRDVIVKIFRELRLDQAVKELEEIPELSDYELRED